MHVLNCFPPAPLSLWQYLNAAHRRKTVAALALEQCVLRRLRLVRPVEGDQGKEMPADWMASKVCVTHAACCVWLPSQDLCDMGSAHVTYI